MKAENPILAQKTFKTDFSTWQLLGLERTLLSGLPHIYNYRATTGLTANEQC